MELLILISRKILLAVLPAALLFACARQGAPTGGPKDTDPPGLDTTLSTRNFSTRFTGRRIELVFDEWITLGDIGTQVVISPTLKKRPEITLKGKKVTVEFNEADTLHANTTYTINFGTAVKDLHEGNPAKDLRFVFSTGDYLDSLAVGGNVVDAFTGEPVENASVMLYDKLSDSIVRKERPYYFARTDKTGQFSIQNVRAGTFKAIGIDDASGDLKWDGQNERIAFPDSFLALGDSARRSFFQLKMFRSQSQFRLFDSKTLRYGLVKLAFTASPDTVNIRTEAPGVRFLTEKVQDTLLVWYDLTEPAAWQLLAGNDTVRVRDLPRDDFFKNYRFAPSDVGGGGSGNRWNAKLSAPGAVKNISQSPVKRGLIPFNAPVASLDTSKWVFVSDSIRLYNFLVKPDSAMIRNVEVRINWSPGKTYKLTLLPGAVTDFYGISNVDTLERAFIVYTEKQLGNLSLTMQDLHPGSRYVLQLLNGSTIEEEHIFEATAENVKVPFTSLPAATYTARLVEDLNRNNHWDTGDYFAHRQPEPVFTKKLEALRANWELEATMQTKVDTKWGASGKK